MKSVPFGLQPKQIEAFNSPATEILYGGSAGGGKSYWMRVSMIAWCMEIPGLHCFLFRRVMQDLISNHVDGTHGFRAMLAPWVEAGKVEIIETEIRFWNGSKITLAHCQLEKHRFKFQGAEIHVLALDELTLFTDKIYRFLRNRVRMSDQSKVPEKYKGRFPRIIAASNPGNVGHLFVKKTFIDSAEPMKIWRTSEDEGGMLRCFIPAKLTDNKKLMEADPNYINRLRGLGSEALVKAMLDGNWDVIDGAFFDKWDPDKNVVKPFKIPAEWTRFAAMDWGYAKPFCVQWYAIADGRYGSFPRGALICYREYYGCQEGKEDVGLRMNAEEVRDKILEKTGSEKLAYMVCDPAMWGTQTGPSPAEILYNETGRGIKSLKKANNSRVGDASAGWDQMRARILGQVCTDGELRPMIYFFDTCRASIRTIPAMVHDEDRPEDLNTDQEDHASDTCRYACASRPIIIKRPQDKPRAPRAGHVESGTMIAPPLGTPEGWQAPQEDLDR